MNKITADELRCMNENEGIIIQGCGGDLTEWENGINDILTEEGILRSGSRFTDISVFENDGLTCLLFKFTPEVDLDIGKLAIWRLRSHETFGGTWLSDYVENSLGGFVAPTEQKM